MLSPKFSDFFPLSLDDIVFLVDNSIEFCENSKRHDFDGNELNLHKKGR